LGGGVAEAKEYVALAEDGDEVVDPSALRQRTVRLPRFLLDGLLGHSATQPRKETLGYLTGERIFCLCVGA